MQRRYLTRIMMYAVTILPYMYLDHQFICSNREKISDSSGVTILPYMYLDHQFICTNGEKVSDLYNDVRCDYYMYLDHQFICVIDI